MVIWGPWQYSGIPDLGDYVQISWRSKVVKAEGCAEGIVIRIDDTESHTWVELSPGAAFPEDDPHPAAYRFRIGRLPDAEKHTERREVVPA